MGQTVEIRDSVNLGDVLLLDTDRSFTGQDGQEITRMEPGDGVPARLALALFQSDPAIDYVFTLQNTVSVRRSGGWDDKSADSAQDTITSFLRFYED